MTVRKGVQNTRSAISRCELTRDELLSEFPCLSWSEKQWVQVLTKDAAMLDALADRFEYLNEREGKRVR